MPARNICADPDALSKRVVARRALDQHAEAGVGEASAVVLRHRMHHLALAARHQHVRHGFAQ